MDQDSQLPDLPAHVRKAQAQSVSQLQHISVPPEALSGRPPPRARRRSSMKTYILIGVMMIVITVAVFFLVRSMQS